MNRIKNFNDFKLNENVDDDLINYESTIDPEYSVFIFYKNNPNYKKISKMLKSMNNSIASLLVGTNNIFMDGEVIDDQELTREHILAIEAHEIAHSILNHAGGLDMIHEIEADEKAIELLLMRGYTTSAQYLQDRLDSYENEKSQ